MIIDSVMCAITTGDIELAGLHTIWTHQLMPGDKVLVMSQNDARQNGLYVALLGKWGRYDDVAFYRQDHAIDVQTGPDYGYWKIHPDVLKSAIEIGYTQFLFTQVAA